MAIPAPRWDLSDLYAGIDDPAIERDQKKVTKAAKTFHSKSTARITSNISAAATKKHLEEYESILAGVRKVQAYIKLRFSTHCNDAAIASKMQLINTWAVSVHSLLIPFELAFSKLLSTKIASLSKDSQLQKYKHWIVRQADWKEHLLSEQEEALLLETSLTGRGAFVRLYGQENAKREFHLQEGKRVITTHESEVLQRLYSPKREVRKNAAESLYEGLSRDIDRTSFIYNMIVQDVIFDTRRRNFEKAEDARHLDNETTRKAADVLSSTVAEHYGLVHEYYNFKRKLLKLPSLYEYDRYAPVAKSTKQYTFAEARSIVLNAFGEFSPAFREIAQKFFDNKWIDAKTEKGKQGGAYCMYVTPSTHPYILMNFTGTMNDVMTLAHELGHGIHGYLARQQSFLHFDWPITTSEIASIFAEMVVFNALKDTLTSQQKLSLYMLKIEGVIAAVFRQIAMFEFEREVFAKRAEKELAPQELNAIWHKQFAAMYGSAVKQSKGSDVGWSGIPHLPNWPFYVYSYAFGDLLTRSLFALYAKNGDEFVSAYIDMLSAGGSKSPQELLGAFGADPEKKAFWKGGMHEIEKLIAEVKTLV